MARKIEGHRPKEGQQAELELTPIVEAVGEITVAFEDDPRIAAEKRKPDVVSFTAEVQGKKRMIKFVRLKGKGYYFEPDAEDKSNWEPKGNVRLAIKKIIQEAVANERAKLIDQEYMAIHRHENPDESSTEGIKM